MEVRGVKYSRTTTFSTLDTLVFNALSLQWVKMLQVMEASYRKETTDSTYPSCALVLVVVVVVMLV